MDFCGVTERCVWSGRGENKKLEAIELVPEFKAGTVKDLMIKGNKFYAIWDEKAGMWSENERDVQRLVDEELYHYRDLLLSKKYVNSDVEIRVKSMSNYSSGSWSTYRKYIRDSPDQFVPLNTKLTFADTVVKRTDYASKRLPYSLVDGDYSAWDKLIGKLYAPVERQKLEWAIGAVVSGDSKKIEKFIALYGEGGTGKSTVIKIIGKLFDGYCATVDAKAIGSSANRFSLEMLRKNPLVVMQPDAKLDRIDDNTKLNSMVAHEVMIVDEKGKPTYESRANCFLFIGTNSPVKITDSRSGLIRRLIDVVPTGQKFPPNEYKALITEIDFELGAIAKHCLDVYREMGENYYMKYEAQSMMKKTNMLFNFVYDNREELSGEEGISLKRAYDMYRSYCEDIGLDKPPLLRYQFKDELSVYFDEFQERARVNGEQVRSCFIGFKNEKLDPPVIKKEPKPPAMSLDDTVSLLDDILKDCKAQYAVERKGEMVPEKNWNEVTTTLKDLDTTREHYIHGKALTEMKLVTVDFDLKDETGQKSMLLNLEAASKWPKTYAEFSRGGCGIHLEYFYTGDLDKVASVYAPGIEIKIFRGNAALRRRLSKCNNIPIRTLDSGLPVKEEKMLDVKEIKDAVHLQNLIQKTIREKTGGGTKTAVDFIDHLLNEAYAQGFHYDLSEMYHEILVFAMNSTHNSEYCMKKLMDMKFKSKDVLDAENNTGENAAIDRQDERRRIAGSPDRNDAPIIFLDVEVFINLFLVNWKFEGEGQAIHRMINPSPKEIEELFFYRIVGFNCRKYDNHMLYARYLGKSTEELYDLSQRIIVEGAKDAFYPEAYDISYTDIYDYAKTKQSLKKWEIQLGIHHKELGLPWDQPVPEEMWKQVAEYCDNDVIATEAVWNATHADFIAREILADVAGLSVNDTTNAQTTRIIFGTERNPQSQFNYRDMGDLSDVSDIYDAEIKRLGLDPEFTKFDSKGRPLFPGYTYSFGKSIYRGEEVGEGGYVFATTGIFKDVPVIDVASMHPSSIVDEQLFGEYFTRRFQDILEARIAIKHKDYERAGKMLDGKLAKYLTDKSSAKALSDALKIAINSVYGLTAARFINPFRDKRNVDNIVAKRGALFMVNLKHEVQRRGFTVVHIKTDSIKIAEATPEIIQFCMDYGKLYGYNFEHESTYDRICLVNDAVYIARYADREKCEKLYGYIPDKNEGQYRDGVRVDQGWTATGAQFAQPYVFKTLFSGEPLTFADYCETKSVSGSAIYLDMNEGYPDVTDAEEEWDRRRYNAEHFPNGVGDSEAPMPVAECRKEGKACESCQYYDARCDGWCDKYKKSGLIKKPSKKPKKLSPTFAAFSDDDLRERIASGHNYQFVGRTGLFYPIREGAHGGIMYREKDGKYFAVTGTKGYRWLEAETVQLMGVQDDLDPMYHEALATDAIETINQFGDFDTFVNKPDSPYILKVETEPTSVVPCGDGKYNTCMECPACHGDQCHRGYSLSGYFH